MKGKRRKDNWVGEPSDYHAALRNSQLLGKGFRPSLGWNVLLQNPGQAQSLSESSLGTARSWTRLCSTSSCGSWRKYGNTFSWREIWAGHLPGCFTSHSFLIEVIAKHINPPQDTQTKCISLIFSLAISKNNALAHSSATGCEWEHDRVEVRGKRQWFSLVAVKMSYFCKFTKSYAYGNILLEPLWSYRKGPIQMKTLEFKIL